MSRCFPYSVPGNKLNGGSNEALIDSIKLQRKRKHSDSERKKEKKEKKREKKEKRKEKKEKANPSITHHLNHDEKIKKVEECSAGPKDGSVQWVKEQEIEQLERSNLTEEHEQPIICCSQNPSSSSDSTQNSNKRKRNDSPAIVDQEWNASRVHGNVVRIRLSSKKQQVVDASVGREEPCSTSGRIDLPTHQKHQIVPAAVEEKNFPTPCGTNDVTGMLPCRTDGESASLRSRNTEATIEKVAFTWYKTPDKKFRKLDLKYKDLIENWIPPPLQMELDSDDQDWLFKRKDSEKQVEKKLKTSEDTSCSSNTMWPRAQFLPEADIYALPFTVPF